MLVRHGNSRAPTPHRGGPERAASHISAVAVVRPVVLVVVAVAMGMAAYLGYRGYVSLVPGVEGRAFDNARRVLAFEDRAGLAWEAEVQRSALGTGVLGAALAGFYALAYWPFLLGAGIVTFARDRAAFSLLRHAVLISGAIGLSMILLAPVAPPRLLDGFDDQVAGLGLSSLAHPSSLLNPYAAVPSFHVGWTVLAAAGLGSVLAGRVVRALVWSVPVAMSVAVVTTGNHYLLDVVAGLALAAVSHGAAPAMDRGFEQHRARTEVKRAGRTSAQSRPRLHMASRSCRL